MWTVVFLPLPCGHMNCFPVPGKAHLSFCTASCHPAAPCLPDTPVLCLPPELDSTVQEEMGEKEKWYPYILRVQKKLIHDFILESDSGCNLCWTLTFLRILNMLFLGVLALRVTVQKFYAKLSFLFLKSRCLSVWMKVQVFFYFREGFLIIVLKIPSFSSYAC